MALCVGVVMRHRTRVAIQAPVEVRDAAGGVSYLFETVTDLADLAATVLAGHHPEIRPEMVVLDGSAVYDIVRVAPTLGRRETILVARQVAI